MLIALAPGMGRAIICRVIAAASAALRLVELFKVKDSLSVSPHVAAYRLQLVTPAFTIFFFYTRALASSAVQYEKNCLEKLH